MTDQAILDPPPRTKRWIVALAIGVACGAIAAAHYINAPADRHDFLQVWFSARAMLQDRNPYELVGPGLEFAWDWPLFYPATAFVSIMPLAFLPAAAALAVFVGVSSTLLAFAVSAAGWHRLALFCSMPYVVAVVLGQWSPILSAAFLLPPLAILYAAKPNLGLAFLVATGSPRVLAWAIGGGLTLLAISVAFDPAWPAEWLRKLVENPHRPAIFRMGGPIVLLALLRWRRPEARLIVALACLPQYAYWYEIVPLSLVPATRVETLAFSLVTSAGWIVEHMLEAPATEAAINQQLGALMVFFAYLPAVVIVLRRPNERPSSGGHPVGAVLRRILMTTSKRGATVGSIQRQYQATDPG